MFFVRLKIIIFLVRLGGVYGLTRPLRILLLRLGGVYGLIRPLRILLIR